MPFTTLFIGLAAVLSMQSVTIQNAQSGGVLATNTASNTSVSTPATPSFEVDSTTTSAALEAESQAISNIPALPVLIPASNLSGESTVESQVQAYFADIPDMIYVAQCESGFTQFNSDGSIFRGIVNPEDVGVMQINEYYNGESAQRLGYNILTLEGNMAFARYLYDNYGTQPWSASEKCWAPKIVSANDTQNGLTDGLAPNI